MRGKEVVTQPIENYFKEFFSKGIKYTTKW